MTQLVFSRKSLLIALKEVCSNYNNPFDFYAIFRSTNFSSDALVFPSSEMG